jgi:hypothetical protein
MPIGASRDYKWYLVSGAAVWTEGQGHVHRAHRSNCCSSTVLRGHIVCVAREASTVIFLNKTLVSLKHGQ